MIFRKKMALVELIVCLIIPISSFAMSESEQERLEGASTSRQVPVLQNLQDHHGATFHDEIVFFNVGQGHAALINKIGHVPLLVDAGSNSRPYMAGETYEWTKFKENDLFSKISDKILEYWGNSHLESLKGGGYHLNIIVTHPDQDHKDFVPTILSNLGSASQTYQFHFYPHVLLGGVAAHYSGYSLPGCDGAYTSSCLGLSLKGNLGSLESSGCITHLFCPDGGTDTNSWSVVVRVELEGISAILTGDAGTHVKNQMLERLGGNRESLVSDILLAPHHGSDELTYLSEWDQSVNPKAIIIGAAPNKGQKGNRHPRGEAIYKLLNFPEGRIWKDKVKPHGILYNCKQHIHDTIRTTLFNSRERLFDLIPNLAAPTAATANKWQVAWVDIPLYTLWTTGTLIFKENVNTPQFSDAPNGLMTYVAVPEFKYFLPPEQRDPTLTTLMGLFLTAGEGDREQIARDVLALSTEGTIELAREGIILTDGLSLYQNRSTILRTLLNFPPEERLSILDLAKPLTRANSKNFSVRYRILEILGNLQPEKRKPIIDLLKSHFSLKDAFTIARALEIFSQSSIEESQEIIEIVKFYPHFRKITENVLKIIQSLLNVDRESRSTVFKWAQPFIMPHETNENPHLNFRDVNDNANLIKIFAEVAETDRPLLQMQLTEAIQYLTADREQYLYGENKHFFIKALLMIPLEERTKYLTEMLPLMKRISELKYESWESAVIPEHLAKFYGQESYPRLLDRVKKQLAKGNQGDGCLSNNILFNWGR